jgi:hypothetical protein
MTDAMALAKKTANMVLEGQHDPLLACRELADVGEELSGLLPSEVMDVFVSVSSEIDGLPIGPERAYWAEEPLRVKDSQAANYREQVRRLVEDALRAVLEATGDRRPKTAD